MHLGLIGGIGPAATEFYYRELFLAHKAAGSIMDLTIVHADVNLLAKNALADDREPQARDYARLTHRLKAAGAEAVAITSVGGHFCAEEFAVLSPLPILHIAPAIAAAVTSAGCRRIGILGTRVAMETDVYGGLSGVVETVIPPTDAEIAQVHDDYVGMAVARQATDEQRERLIAAGRALCEDQGADAVLLAGTDLLLAFDGVDPGYPVIDGAAAHVAWLFEKTR